MSKSRYAFPDTVWHSRGLLPDIAISQLLHDHLSKMESDGVIDKGCLSPMPSFLKNVCWYAFDATWTTPDGAVVRGRLLLWPRDMSFPQAHAMIAEESEISVEGLWTITAEADRPWDYSWPSPLSIFFPLGDKKVRPRDAGHILALDEVTSLDVLVPERMLSAARSLQKMNWLTCVITHDPRPRLPAMKETTLYTKAHPGAKKKADVPLLQHFPRGLLGRVVEIRVHDRDVVHMNAALKPLGVTLPEGGAVILPPERYNGDLAELSFSAASAFTNTITPLLQNRAAMQPLLTMVRTVVDSSRWVGEGESDRMGLLLHELRDEWVLVDAETGEVIRLRKQITKLTGELDEKNAALDKLDQRLKQAESDLAAAESRAAGTDEPRAQPHHSAETVQSAAQLAAAEADLEAAELLLDDRAREISWLRRELAEAGRFYDEPMPQETSAPSTWDELLERGAELPGVSLVPGDLHKTISTLRGHTMERVWIDRCWQTLKALSGYVLAKRTYGPQQVPNMASYLQGGHATDVIPTQRYQTHENGQMVAKGKYSDTRIFSVPPQVHPEGRVRMAEHIRIGAGKPPAPRLHFYDDTSGATGAVHVGYIGKHLPNTMTN